MAEQFVGERFVQTPISRATEAELRNRPWPDVLEHARRLLRFSQYTPHGDIWVPNTLKQGDIIRCDLPTDYMQDGTPEIWPRNVMVLGINIARDTETELMEIASIAVMRLSYNINDMNDEFDYLIDRNDPQTWKNVTGLTKSAVLRTSSAIDIVTPTSEFFGFYIDKVGSIDPALFDDIEDKIAIGYKTRMHRPLRDHFGVRSANTFFVPSISADYLNDSHDFMQDENLGRDFFDLDYEQQEELSLDLEMTALEKANERRILLRRQRKTEQDMRHEQWRDKMQRIRANKLRRSRLNGLSKSQMVEAMRRVRENIEHDDDAHQQRLVAYDQDPSTDITEQDDLTIETIDEMLMQQLDPDIISMRKKQAAEKAIADQAIDPQSLSHLENFGIGGLRRESKIKLPDHLWRGRFLMMRAADLLDPSNMDDAYRPCMVHKAYARINDKGEPELAGMELFPCTQSAAHHFRYKMPVMPLGKTVKLTQGEQSRSSHMFKLAARKPSWLVADVMIRAPMSTEYFQPEQTTNFLQMPPGMIEKFQNRVEHCRQNEGEHTIWGLQEVPEDWFEIDLPDVPTDPKLQRYTGARFEEKVPKHVQQQIDQQKQRRHARAVEKRAHEKHANEKRDDETPSSHPSAEA